MPGHVLLERDRELGAIAAAQRAAACGDGGIVLVEAGAGVGKSALLAVARADGARDGFDVLSARASDFERSFAFGVVRQLFEPPLRRSPKWLEGAARSAGPVFGLAQSGDRDDQADGAFEDVTQAVLHGLYWLTVNACAERPLLLSIDDLQSADLPSLRFLSYLGRRLEGLSTLVIGSVRTNVGLRPDPLVAELEREPSAVVVEPAPLSQLAVGALLEDRLGAPAPATFVAACHDATGGNPLLLDELVRALLADGVRPDTADVGVVRDLGLRAVSRTVFVRLARLDDAAIAVAQAVAVLGEGAELAILEGMTGLSGPAVETSARQLVAAEILRTESPLGFVHALVRDAIYEELSALEREARHATAARLLHAAGGPAESVAGHALVLAPASQPWVVEALVAAARTAVQRGAPENAGVYLRRALREPPPVGQAGAVVLELGMAEVLANEPLAASEHLRTAYAASSDPLVRGRTAEALSRMLIFTSPPADAVVVARQAQEDLPPELDDLRCALQAVELYAVRFGADDDDTLGRLLRARRDSTGDGPGARMLMAVLAWQQAMTGETADESSSLALDALAGGLLVAHDPGFMAIVAAGVLALADRDEALDAWAAAMAAGHTGGSRITVSGVHLWRGWTWLQRGALADARDDLEDYVAATEQRGGAAETGMTYGSGFLARLLVEQGELASARAVVQRAGGSTPGSDGDLHGRRAMIELLLAEGEWEGALRQVDEGRSAARGPVNPAWAPFGALASRALVGLGRAAEAVGCARDELVAARRWGAPGTVGAALRAIGVSLDALGSDECIPVLGEAAAVTAPSPCRLEHAKDLAALGSALRRRGRAADARGSLAQAADLAAICGAPSLAELAATELAAAGGRRTSRGVVGVDALTPSERRVGALAAAGRSNKAIAQELFVTPKTVEVHLSNAYRKLGITSRSELAGTGLVLRDP